MDPQRFDNTVERFVQRISEHDLTEDATVKEIVALGKFAELRRLVVTEPEPVIPSPPLPETMWTRAKAGAAKIWDNETTRVAIKAGGAFAGVAVVAWSTIHKDHVIERQAFAQANTRTV